MKTTCGGSIGFLAAPMALLLIVAGTCAASGPYDHVLILSIDGLHQADITDPALAADMPNILQFAAKGIDYTNAHCVTPSDSFPTSLAMFTGASPKTTGLYYDNTYNRSLIMPSNTLSTAPGTAVAFDGSINIAPSLMEGATGGHSDATSIDPTKLPRINVGGVLQPVYPHNYLKVNTVFELRMTPD